ncbi:hypothetical protein CAEBREN_18165 [Caenorhabditis brenneri]|uniref:Uncharacterized protein n=1 Tax=Caenorhabditis brenneri TaxID=135651 RepID=G0MI37_CAEBE|nr:hypothetical protein CAEBREN_18165 [Caenorhabditis brenneri]
MPALEEEFVQEELARPVFDRMAEMRRLERVNRANENRVLRLIGQTGSLRKVLSVHQLTRQVNKSREELLQVERTSAQCISENLLELEEYRINLPLYGIGLFELRRYKRCLQYTVKLLREYRKLQVEIAQAFNIDLDLDQYA